MNGNTRRLCFLFVIGLSSVFLLAQGPTTGTPAFGSYTSGQPDVINLSNLNVHYEFPIFSKPGRGTAFSYTLTYDSSVWYPAGSSPSQYWQPVGNWGWAGRTQAALGYIRYRTLQRSCYDPLTHITYYWDLYTFDFYVDNFGIQHRIGVYLEVIPADCGGGGFETRTVQVQDGSPVETITVQLYPALSGTVKMRNGAVINPPVTQDAAPGTYTDQNGNQISANNGVFTDTLNRSALTISGSNPVSYTYIDSNGTQQSVVVNYTSYMVQTNFGAGINEYPPTVVNLVSSIRYPDNSTYQFTYEPTPTNPPCNPDCTGHVTGRIASITLRTGGQIQYVYTGGYNGILTDGSAAGFNRITSDGTASYSRNGPYLTVTDPQGNQTVYTFSGIYETFRQIYQGTATGSPIRRYMHCYNGNWTSCETATVSAPIYSHFLFTILDADPATGNSLITVQGADFNSYGLPTTTYDDYEWGTYIPGSTGNGANKRFTRIDYAPLGNGIVDRPATISVYTGPSPGTLAAQTTFAYDEPGTITPINPPPPQHIAISGSRGNVTHKTEWLFGGTNPSTAYTYDDAGNVLTVVDPGGHTTSYLYSPAFANAYVTQTTLPNTGVAHILQANYDINTGRMISSTDQNNQTTTYTYDSMLRPSTITFPDMGQTTYSYFNPTQTETKRKVDSTNWTEHWEQVDGYGRLERVADRNGEVSPYHDMYDYCYSPKALQTFANYPYQGSGWGLPKACSVDSQGVITSSQPGDKTGYDALGRPTLVAHSDNSKIQYAYTRRATQITEESNGSYSVSRISQIDSRGRLASLCEIYSGSDLVGVGTSGHPTSCGLDRTGTGFLTNYWYDTLDNFTRVLENGVYDRIYSYDSLSRLISKNGPEDNPNTTSYTYNSDSLLTQKVSPAPNVASGSITTTYTYDLLHRVTDIQYTGISTPSVHNNYDLSPIYGVTPLNPIGRLVTTETSVSRTAKIYSYDPMGRVVTNWQCVPRVCSYPLTYTYDLAGNMSTFTDGVSHTFTHTRNAVGRLTGMTSSLVDASHPATLLSNVHYGAMGPTSDSLGNGINEARGYDVRTGPQAYTAGTVYSFNLNRAPNGNVTIGTDSANGVWSYTYDQFNRLATSTQNAGQAFAYDYDRFGNRWNQRQTAGPPGPQPSYSFNAYNHIIPSINSPFAYDAAGNMTNDTFHSYTYDAENRVISVDGGATASYIYDAEGRRIKKTVGASSFEFLYDLDGHAITELDGSSGVWNRGEVYADGTHIATYVNNTTYFSHQDWLGTERVHTLPDGTVAETCLELAFGDQQSGCSATHLGFTGYFHDGPNESNLEHSWFRQYSSTQGRYISPDPYTGSMDLANPQSLNRYTYVMNDPMDAVDPLGLDGQWFYNGSNGGRATQYSWIDVTPDGLRGDGSGHMYIAPLLDTGTEGSSNGGSGNGNSDPGVTTADLNPFNDRAPLAFQGFVNLFLNGDVRRGVPQLAVGLLPGALASFAVAKFAGPVITPGLQAAANARLASRGLSATTAFNSGKGLLNGETTGMTQHALSQVLARGVTNSEITEALTHVPKGTGDLVLRFIGQGAEVRVNQVTGRIITVIRFSGPN